LGGFPFPTDPAAAPLRDAYPHAGLRVKRGDVVVVAESGEPWWIGDVIAVHGGPRHPTVPDFIQVRIVDPVGSGWWSDVLNLVDVLVHYLMIVHGYPPPGGCGLRAVGWMVRALKKTLTLAYTKPVGIRLRDKDLQHAGFVV
jgi:hypothetical protein